MANLTIIIPARNERFLDKTIGDIYMKATEDINVIVILDGWDTNRLSRVNYIHNQEAKGMRTCINQGVREAKTKYIMKLDAHCMLAPDFDKILKIYHKPNWVQIPTRKRLNAHKWEIIEGKPDIDYMCLNESYMGIEQPTRAIKYRHKVLDDTEVFQGSCYFITKKFFNKCNLLDDVNFNSTGHEAAEIAYKVRKAKGRIIRNKMVWYAHARLSRKYASDKTKSRESIKKLYDNLL